MVHIHPGVGAITAQTFLVAIIALIFFGQSSAFVAISTPLHSSSNRFLDQHFATAATPGFGRRDPVRVGTRMGLEEIKVVAKASEDEIQKLGARNWPTWGCGVSKFPWTYEGTETCLILEGDVTVTPDDDRQPVTVGAGDICVFPDGMKCTWDVRAAIKKHYKFE